LQASSGNQQADIGCDRTDQRCDREPCHTDHEDLPAPKAVAERAGEQDEPGDGEQVSRRNPLQACDLSVELLADGRLRNADDGGVELSHGAAQHGRREYPPPASRGQVQATGLPSGACSS
jgi:hypothetical protein